MTPVEFLSEEERKRYMDIVKDFMIEDCRKAVCIGLNYLVALGMSSYTEILGSLCDPSLPSKRAAYYLFLEKYFDDKYIERDRELEEYGGLYGVVRSGFVHQFLITKNSTVFTNSETQLDCAIIYNPGKSPEIIFVAEEYFKHFKCALETYYDDLINKKDQKLIENFDERVKKAWRLKEKDSTKKAKA